MRTATFMTAIIGAGIGMFSVAFSDNPGKPNRFLTKNGKLAETFTLTDVQGGFAGFTGNTYVVKPDGSYTVTRVFNRRKFKPHATGTLNGLQLKSLADTLQTQNADLLPKSAGSRAQANPLVVTITFGKHRSEIALPAGADDPKSLPKGEKGDIGRRALTIRNDVRKLIVVKKTP